MPTNVLLPKWGMGMNDGTVVKWLKQEGDPVEEGDPLCEIESAKVNADVEAPGAGTLARVVVPEGMTVDTGSLLAVILAAGEQAELPAPLSLRVSASAASSAAAAPVSPAAPAPAPGGRRQVTPIARRLARELGVDVDTVAGTGPGGRVVEDDVRAAAEAGEEAPGPGVSEIIKLSGLRATIARRMTESGAAPTVTLTHEADVTETVAIQRRLVREWRPHRIRPQYQDLVLAATARALAEHPGMNAHLVGDEIRVLSDINLGFAVSVPGGLIVPVIQDAGAKSALEIAREVRRIMSREKANELHVDDMRGGTFVVTNLGAVGVDAFDPLLDPPMIGILGVGRVVEKPAVVDGEVVVRSMCYLSLTFDHRAVDGYPAGEFLRTVTRNLASPDWMVDND